jgi:hypothetical protein
MDDTYWMDGWMDGCAGIDREEVLVLKRAT